MWNLSDLSHNPVTAVALCASKARDVRELWELFLKDLLGRVKHDVSTLRAGSAKVNLYLESCRNTRSPQGEAAWGSLALADASQDHDMIDLVELTVPFPDKGFKDQQQGMERLSKQGHCARA